MLLIPSNEFSPSIDKKLESRGCLSSFFIFLISSENWFPLYQPSSKHIWGTISEDVYKMVLSVMLAITETTWYALIIFLLSLLMDFLKLNIVALSVGAQRHVDSSKRPFPPKRSTPREWLLHITLLRKSKLGGVFCCKAVLAG